MVVVDQVVENLPWLLHVDIVSLPMAWAIFVGGIPKAQYAKQDVSACQYGVETFLKLDVKKIC